ncbi:urea transporter [Prescottella equi NBRC 101255 = C 7]|nr:urea transporter [Prescottella equi NBRC 101255 = C 7]
MGEVAFVIAAWLFLLPKKRLVPVQHDTIRGGAAEPRQSSGSA